MTLRWLSPLVGALALLACAPRAIRASTPSSRRGDLPVALTYLGVAGWRLDDAAHALLVDPFFSRTRVDDWNVTLTPDPELIARYAPSRADAILVEHSHYDHVLDVPDIAKRSGATIVGTESTLNVARAAGISDAHLRLARGGEVFTFGPFSVRPIRGLHSLTGQPSATIPPGVDLPMKASAYAEGGTLDYLVRVEGRVVLFIGSANFVESELEGLRPGVAVIAVGLREKIPDYSCRLMRLLGRPPLVLANHFDAFSQPLGPAQMDIGEEGLANLAKFADEIHACAPETKVVVPTHFHSIAL